MRDNEKETQLTRKQVASPPKKKEVRHMLLYIQMQLCSQKTLGDFLANPRARKGASEKDAVDIPLALVLFHQIAQGVKHVHEQGLIHRDLKPCNCFIDDAGVVKVGDFGLSRESGDIGEDANLSILDDGVEDNTAGVGTRSYASPEQMKGSDYGASTDVYSLGIMLFELCYPMSTVSQVV
jgi:serine/threonine protein kinase